MAGVTQKELLSLKFVGFKYGVKKRHEKKVEI